MENYIKLMRGDLVKMKSKDTIYFVLNPERENQVVVQNTEDKNDFRYINYYFFDAGLWTRYTEAEPNKEN